MPALVGTPCPNRQGRQDGVAPYVQPPVDGKARSVGCIGGGRFNGQILALTARRAGRQPVNRPL